MITANQIIIHLFSDFFIQNDWMATNKKKSGLIGELACWSHILTYTLPFLLITNSIRALIVIGLTHYIIDRTNLVAWLIWQKNKLSQDKESTLHWYDVKDSMGMNPNRPLWLSTWIGIVVDNTFHIILNGLAIHYL